MTTANKKLKLAREWAVNVHTEEYTTEHLLAAAETINELPNQVIDANGLQEWMDDYLRTTRVIVPHTAIADMFTDLQNTFLTPPRAEIKLGGQAMHPEHGKVLIASARPDHNYKVRTVAENDLAPDGVQWYEVLADSLAAIPDDDEPNVVNPGDKPEFNAPA